MTFSLQHRAENELYWSFGVTIGTLPLRPQVGTWIEKCPPLVYVLLKAYPPTEEKALPEPVSHLCFFIVKSILRSANELGIATLVGLEKIAQSIKDLPTEDYMQLLMIAALSIRPKTLFQETLLTLHESRCVLDWADVASAYLHKQLLAVAFDCAEEAADACPCDDNGKPRRGQRSYPVQQVLPTEDHGKVKIHLRVDLSIPVRLHSHIRLLCVSNPAHGWVNKAVLDGVVTKATRGEMTVDLFHPLPPEASDMQWNIYEAGSIGEAIFFDIIITIYALSKRLRTQ